MGSTTKRAFTIAASFVLLAAGCPDDDSVTTDTSAADDAPPETEAPAIDDTPLETEPPADTGVPDATEAPADTGVPDATEAPVETGVPDATEAPAALEPTAIDALFEYGIDNANGQFIETDTPAAAVEVIDVSLVVNGQATLTVEVAAPDASPIHRITFFSETADGGNLNFTCESISDGDGGTLERNGARLFRSGDVPIEQAPPGCDTADPFSITMPLNCVAGTLSAFVVDETDSDLVLPVAGEYVVEVSSGDLDDGAGAVYALDLSSTSVCSE